jgi:glycosyltransferase involved in cell wall biosynthesis
VQCPARRDALKTYEYLACGRPVILTNDEVVPALKPFVCHASDVNAFADACREMTAPDYVQHVQGAKYVLVGLTWENRTERCLRICMEYASCKQHEHANL